MTSVIALLYHDNCANSTVQRCVSSSFSHRVCPRMHNHVLQVLYVPFRGAFLRLRNRECSHVKHLIVPFYINPFIMVQEKKDIIDIKQALSNSKHETPKLFSLSACPLHRCFQNLNVHEITWKSFGCTVFFDGKGPRFYISSKNASSLKMNHTLSNKVLKTPVQFQFFQRVVKFLMK